MYKYRVQSSTFIKKNHKIIQSILFQLHLTVKHSYMCKPTWSWVLHDSFLSFMCFIPPIKENQLTAACLFSSSPSVLLFCPSWRPFWLHGNAAAAIAAPVCFSAAGVTICSFSTVSDKNRGNVTLFQTYQRLRSLPKTHLWKRRTEPSGELHLLAVQGLFVPVHRTEIISNYLLLLSLKCFFFSPLKATDIKQNQI